jgi:hypothetical protein
VFVHYEKEGLAFNSNSVDYSGATAPDSHRLLPSTSKSNLTLSAAIIDVKAAKHFHAPPASFVFVLAVAFLVVIPEGDLLLPL